MIKLVVAIAVLVLAGVLTGCTATGVQLPILPKDAIVGDGIAGVCPDGRLIGTTSYDLNGDNDPDVVTYWRIEDGYEFIWLVWDNNKDSELPQYIIVRSREGTVKLTLKELEAQFPTPCSVPLSPIVTPPTGVKPPAKRMNLGLRSVV